MNYSEIPFTNELKLFHRVTGIPLCVFDNTPKDKLRYPFIASMECSAQTLYRCCEALKKKRADEYFPILYSSAVCFFALLKLDENTNVMFGPVSSKPLTYREFYNCSRMDCELDDLLHLYQIIQKSPRITLAQFASSLCLFVQLAFGKKITPEDILASHMYYPTIYEEHMENEIEEPRYITIAEAMNFQKKIIGLVQNGNVGEIQKIFNNTLFFSDLENSMSSDEDLGKMFFVYATICNVAVLEEGLELQKAFPIFDTYVSKIPYINAPEKLRELCRQLSIDYAEQMLPLQNARSNSPVVTKCLQYIQNNICSKITIEDLAQHCNVSRRTITRHFSEYHPVQAAECILFYKLKEAAFLLTHSNFSLVEISNHLSFSSQSHFTVTFKKKYSCTPQKYREKYKKGIE